MRVTLLALSLGHDSVHGRAREYACSRAVTLNGAPFCGRARARVTAAQRTAVQQDRAELLPCSAQVPAHDPLVPGGGPVHARRRHLPGARHAAYEPDYAQLHAARVPVPTRPAPHRVPRALPPLVHSGGGPLAAAHDRPLGVPSTRRLDRRARARISRRRPGRRGCQCGPILGAHGRLPPGQLLLRPHRQVRAAAACRGARRPV